MVKIKRTKTANGTTATHWVAAVAPNGCITGLNIDAAKALNVSAEMAAKVKEFYAKQDKFGRLDFLPGEVSDAEKFQAEISKLDAVKLNQLRMDLERAQKQLAIDQESLAIERTKLAAEKAAMKAADKPKGDAPTDKAPTDKDKK